MDSKGNNAIKMHCFIIFMHYSVQTIQKGYVLKLTVLLGYHDKISIAYRRKNGIQVSLQVSLWLGIVYGAEPTI